MKKLSFFTICLFTIFFSRAQQDLVNPERPGKPSIAFVKTYDNKKLKGWLYAANDSQVVLVRSLKMLSNPSPGGTGHQIIPIENIRKASLRKKNSVLRGTLIGLGIGALTGVVIGFASGDDPVYTGPVTDPFSGIFISLSNAFAMTAGEKAVAGGLGLGAGGAIIGAIIGAIAKKKFIIGGKKEITRDLQAELMRKLVLR